MNEEKQNKSLPSQNEIEKEEKMRTEARAKVEKDIKEKQQMKQGIGYLVILGIIIFFIAIIFTGGNGENKKTDENYKEEILFGLDEETKKEIWKGVIRCEDEAHEESMKRYWQGCQDCPEFIVADRSEQADLRDELTVNCKEERIRKKYNINRGIELEISMEATREMWEMPEPLPLPECCDF